MSVESRIEENRPFLDGLKTDKQFQNLLIFMCKSAVSEERVLDFLTGKSSLEACLGEKKWMTELLVNTYGGLEVCWHGSHFLSELLATRLSTIFKQGYFEFAEKSHFKMSALMGSIKRDEGSEKLDLADANPSVVFFCEADLFRADLSGADLAKATLRYTNFSEANLTGADLSEADLCGADLSGADLSGTNLSRAHLVGAHLAGACLSKANLRGADLFGANLSKADLSKADLSEANLTETDMSGADLRSTRVRKEQLLHTKLIGAWSNNDDISAMITKQTINKLVSNSPHFTLNQLVTVNVECRIQENRPFMEKVKTDKQFQNLLIFMSKSDVSQERVLDFLTGKTSLESCLGEETWMTEVLVRTYGGLKVRWNGSHFLSEPLATTLSTIFKLGYFESAEKSYYKMFALMDSIKRNKNSEKVDLAGADLSGIYFCEADLSGADLSRANLSKTKVRSANFSETTLTGANLSEADFSGVNLAGADLSGADLSRADLTKTDLTGTYFSRAKLHSANLSRSNVSKANLRGADLSEADLSEANLSGADLRKANLFRANLSGADNLTGAKFTIAKLRLADLCGADLSGADLSGAYLFDANLSKTHLSGANLSGASLSKADLSGADLSRACLFKTNLSGANLSGAYLSGASLSKANSSGAIFSNAYVSKADLSGADFSEADLMGANLTRTNLSGANLRSTRVKIEQLFDTKLIGSRSNNDEISALIKQQTVAEASKKYQLLSQVVKEFTFEGTPFPEELLNKIGRNLI
ncbi:MAG: pentapeptide repeat protein [Solimicrobium sp.]|nr:pentapeptide repeat protein [Solimicrobium sp.]